ncbi:MAG: ABC transporter permease [Blautia sp.]|nr:ABC transporter permease [Blautia sp.]
MKQFLNVLKFELGNYFKSRSFMVTTVLLALVVAAAVALPPVFMKGSFSDVFGGGKESSKETAESSSRADNYDPDAALLGIADPEGFVSDLAGLTDRMLGYQWKVFDSADELEQFVEAGGDGGFLLTGKFTYTYVVRDRSLLDSQDSEFSEIYTSYWQEKELEEAGIAASKVQEILNQSSISTMQILGKDGASNYWYTYILVFVLYFLVIFYGQMIATSITSEKSNRAIEVLVTTVDSTSLIFGKVIAGAISGIFQAGVILGSGLIAYHFCGAGWDYRLDFLFHIPAEVWAAFIVFGLLSYLLYAFLFGMLGALVSKTEDISKSATPVTMVFVVSFIITMTGMNESDMLLMKVASFIPFTSGNAMFARIALGSVSPVEVVVSAVLLAATVVFLGWLAAKIFRFGTLMYGNPIKFTQALKKLREQ